MAQVLKEVRGSNVMFDPYGMLAILRETSAVLSEEIRLLDDMKIAEIHKLYNTKIELITILEGYKEMLANNPELLDTIPPSTLKEIRLEAAKFEVLIEEDNKQIKRAKEVHKLVMEALRKTLEENTKKSSGYNKRGMIHLEYKGAQITPPVSINTKI